MGGTLLFGLACLLMLAVAGTVLYQRNLDEILESRYARAEALLEAGKYNQAYARFHDIHQKHPDFHRAAEALVMSGEILHLYLHREQEALLAYLLVERDYPDRPQSYRARFRIAEIYKYRLKDYDRALVAYQKLIDSGFGDGARIQYEIADTYFRQKNREQARIEFEQLVKNYPESPLVPEALYRIGATFALDGSFGEAEFVYRKITEEHADNPFALEAQLGLASVLERRGELREALRLLEKLRGKQVKPDILDIKIAQVRKRIEKKKHAI